MTYDLSNGEKKMTTQTQQTLQTLRPPQTTPIALAAMAGVTDLPFRVICRELGADYTVSEMVSAKALLFRNPKTLPCWKWIPRSIRWPSSCSVLVPEELARGAKIVAEHGADIIDFNMGCPVHKIVANGEGSALMKDPERAYACLAAW